MVQLSTHDSLSTSWSFARLPRRGDETDLGKPPGEFLNVIAEVEECLT
jgi:hypothetical protein